MAIIKIKNAAIDLDAAEIPNIDASKITSGSIASARLGNIDLTNLSASNLTSGTIPDARVSASAVSQHATSFDDNAIVNDISTLALRSATSENAIAYSTSNQFIDVFQDASGIGTQTNTNRNASEYVSSVSSSEDYESGDQRSTYTITNSTSSINRPLSNWLNGSLTDNDANAWHWLGNGNNQNGNWIMFDLGSGNSKIFTGAKMYQNGNHNSGKWLWRASNDLNTYTNLSSTFDWEGSLGSSPYYYNEQLWSNTTAFRYIELKGQVGATDTSSPYQTEVQFKIASFIANATGNFISNTITAPTSTSSMGAIITYQDQAGTNALNTDIILQLSADNGSNFTTATLTAMPDFSTGIKMAKVNDLAVTAGTQLKYKISFANQSGSKEARIRGVSLQY